MAARFKKRPPGSVNSKIIKLDMLTLYDLMCPICQSIYIEPVTLPCCHNFCLSCFNGSVENNALACPLCRTRIGSWLRRTTKQNKLVNTKLWEYIQKYFENEVNEKLNGGEVTILEDEPTRILSAPGEIRSEYESEVERLRREQKALEEKQSKESEKLIRELQEQERKQSEERQSKLQQDEELARQLAENSQAITTTVEDSSANKLSPPQQNGHAVTTANSYSSSNGTSHTVTTSGNNKSKQFYDYLASSSSTPSNNKGTKSNTLDRYVVKKNGSANGYKKVHSAEYIVGSPPSPELMSTAGRCGRFLKNFLTARLWGSSVTGCPNSSKTEPKVWEPQDTCASHSRELSVNTGVVQHHHQPPAPMQQRQLNMDDSITEEVVNLDTISEDSLAQELCYFKPLHPEPINRFSGKCRRCIPVRPSQKQGPTADIIPPDVSDLMDGLERLKGPLFWKQASPSLSSFVCLVQVPLQLIKARESSKSSDKPQTVSKPNKKTIKRKHTPTKAADMLYNTRSPSKSATPRKVAKKAVMCAGGSVDKRNAKRDRTSNESSNKDTSPRRSVTNQSLSRSCVKLGSNNSNPNDHVLTRSKRSISFGDIPTNGEKNGLVNGGGNKLSTKMNGIDNNLVINSTRTLRSNGLITKANDCDIKLSNGNKKTSLNGEHVNTNGLNNNYKHSHHCGRNLSSKSAKNYSDGDAVLTNGEFVFDATLVEEQKRIEEMIAQEKKDFALAKKLQKQLCGSDYISTGYTVRTAAKKQATLRDILPVAKKMKV